MGNHHVGILLNAGMHRGIPRGKTAQESISNYEEAAAMFGLVPVFIKLGDIDLASGRTAAYIYRKHQYERVIIPIPPIIHNRAIYSEAAANRRIKALISRDITLFNTNNRYGKDVIHRLLEAHPFIKSYLPDTAPASPAAIRMFMEKYQDLILKPCRGSVGRGIMRLQLKPRGWSITFNLPSRQRTSVTQELPGTELPAYIKRRLERTPYLIQERIPLAEHEGCAFDLRVTVQRGISGEWGVTGLFTKSSQRGQFVSNIAAGGRAGPAYDLLSKAVSPLEASRIMARIEQLVLSIAEYLSARLPLLADLGMDIGVTHEGEIYFIECNGRDQRYGFKKAGMLGTWKASYREPMAFARYLYNQRS